LDLLGAVVVVDRVRGGDVTGLVAGLLVGVEGTAVEAGLVVKVTDLLHHEEGRVRA
jgi:hypothetical protein